MTRARWLVVLKLTKICTKKVKGESLRTEPSRMTLRSSMLRLSPTSPPPPILPSPSFVLPLSPVSSLLCVCVCVCVCVCRHTYHA